jgi:hypothetical protein
MPNLTNITPPRVALVDPETGTISREWYRFFVNMFTITGGGSTQPTLSVTATAPLETTGGANPNISIVGSPLARANDTNVTLTLSGAPNKALLDAVTMTLGWQGVLDIARGGTGPWAPSGAVLVSNSPPAWSNAPVPFGYLTGAGGSVTQSTSRTTGVTCNTPTGQITLFSAAGSTTPASFTVTNSNVSSTDTVILCIQSGATNNYSFNVSAVVNGSFRVTFWAQTGTATDAPVLNYAIIKGASA